MSNNILVTGANGFVGSHLISDLTQSNKNNVVVAAIRDDRQDKWTVEALSDSVKVKLDLNSSNSIAKLKRILSYYDINQIYHLASQTIVSRACKNPIDTYSTNILGTAKVLEAARLIGVKSILHMSTDKTFGEGLLADKRNYNIHSEPYGSSKICTEWIIEDYRRMFLMNITVIRSCNIFGYDRYNLTRIIPAFITKLLNDEIPTIHDEESLRQYIYINDVIQILQRIMGNGSSKNIGSPYVLNPVDLINKICSIIGIETEYKVIPANFYEIHQQSLRHDPDFNFTSIDVALKETIDKFKQYR